MLVTTSHQAPYGFSDGADVMRAIFASPDVDYVSPELYTTGDETANDFALSKGALRVCWVVRPRALLIAYVFCCLTPC